MSEIKETIDKATEKKQKMLQEFYDTTVRGKLVLHVPIQDGDKTYESLFFDFDTIDGSDLLEAVNADRMNMSTNRLSIVQAINLFASAVIKDKRNANGGSILDKYDIVKRMDWQSQVKAWQVTDAFFHTFSLLRESNIIRK